VFRLPLACDRYSNNAKSRALRRKTEKRKTEKEMGMKKKTKLTKQMRKDAVAAMMRELCEPKIAGAKEELASAIEAFLHSLVPADVAIAFAEHPEFFHDLTHVRIGITPCTTWSDRLDVCLRSVPIAEDMRLDFSLDRWHDKKSFPTAAFAKAYSALKNFRRVLIDCEDFQIESDRVLSGIRYAEDIQADFPEGMRFITIPEKPAPLVVRADALKTLVDGIRG
jgi:histone H3/H4